MVRTCSNRKERRVFGKGFPGSRKYLRSTRLGQERGLRIIGRFELACGRVEVQDSKISGLSTISDQTPQNQLRLRAIWITVLRSSYVHVRCTWQDTWH
ncbi:hypothetical protein HKD37_03G006551 [Glycine soja]